MRQFKVFSDEEIGMPLIFSNKTLNSVSIDSIRTQMRTAKALKRSSKMDFKDA